METKTHLKVHLYLKKKKIDVKLNKTDVPPESQGCGQQKEKKKK